MPPFPLSLRNARNAIQTNDPTTNRMTLIQRVTLVRLASISKSEPSNLTARLSSSRSGTQPGKSGSGLLHRPTTGVRMVLSWFTTSQTKSRLTTSNSGCKRSIGTCRGEGGGLVCCVLLVRSTANCLPHLQNGGGGLVCCVFLFRSTANCLPHHASHHLCMHRWLLLRRVHYLSRSHAAATNTRHNANQVCLRECEQAVGW